VKNLQELVEMGVMGEKGIEGGPGWCGSDGGGGEEFRGKDTTKAAR